MKILIAVNDSAHSEGAVQHLTSMRWPPGSRVIVATGVQPGCAVVAARAQARLRAVGMSTEHRMVEGDSRTVLLELIETERVDLLVVDARRRDGAVPCPLGSASRRVVAQAQCSVLVVKQRAMAERGQDHSRAKAAMKILIGVDESAHSKAAVHLVRRMEWPKGTRVGVVSAARSVPQGDAWNALTQAARNERADLIVVGTPARTGLEMASIGSLAQHVVTHSPCSVLIVKIQE
ncbi:MAG: universal stress protein [Candidatus Eisenbacteria bacterium]